MSTPNLPRKKLSKYSRTKGLASSQEREESAEERGVAEVSLQSHEDYPTHYQLVSPANNQTKPRPVFSIFEDWILEAVGILVSAATTIAIVVILRKYNGHEQQDWKHVSLNSLISWLSTIAKACVLFSISQGIGQLKWVWFADQSRPLSDLDTFDSASRGVTGSATLLWLVKGQYVPRGFYQPSPRLGIIMPSC
ncbi:hypothetical protein N7463_007846 [Penicillium fimorum]|uniref:Uncharacterized protein n=1 Tax=Penicillium fimorum TaxID=1882269 RepID=A0A9W9XX84_9EURO|nr:hypothetical protein N7463_007846 [Penicillium fimorum]